MSRLSGMLALASSLSLAACATASGPTASMSNGRRDSIVANGRATKFDTNHAVIDRRRLMKVSSFLGLFKTRGYGTDAEIQPRDSAFAITDTMLNTGLVVARIITRGNGDYPKYHLPESDTVYLWVKRGVDSTASPAYFIPIHGGPIGLGWVEYIDHNGAPNVSYSRWIFDWNDEQAWSTCENGGCCRVH